MKRIAHIFMAVALSALLSGCFFTGVESTKRVSDKEVRRVITELEHHQASSWLDTWRDSLPAWRPGKQFWVADDQARMLLECEPATEADSVHLGGSVITLQSIDVVPSLTGNKVIDLVFTDGKHRLTYHTGKTSAELSGQFTIPMLVDLDMVADLNRQLAGRRAYVKTPLWNSVVTGQPTMGRQLVPVTIRRVEPGNKALPLRVVFVEEPPTGNDSAFVWMSAPSTPMTGRDFDSMFAMSNPRDNYPDIVDAHWAMIQRGEVAATMTKTECRLAMGPPLRIAYVPDQAGMREFWYYDGGAYLFFVDGLLKEFRR